MKEAWETATETSRRGGDSPTCGNATTLEDQGKTQMQSGVKKTWGHDLCCMDLVLHMNIAPISRVVRYTPSMTPKRGYDFGVTGGHTHAMSRRYGTLVD